MYHNFDVPASVETLWKTCHSLVAELLHNCPIKSHNLKVVANKPLIANTGSLYLLKDGTINETFAGQLIVVHESGDLIGGEALIQEKFTAYENDFAVTLDEYDGQTFLDTIAADQTKFLLWNQYLSCLTQSYQLLLCHFSRQESNFSPEFRHYEQGETIIEANTDGDDVFTLMTGAAKVLHNDTEVGEINRDEIFGAIAALTNTKRSASIIATTACDTIVVKSDNFRSLLAARPDTVQKLIHDMARTIVSCNERIIELSKLEP